MTKGKIANTDEDVISCNGNNFIKHPMINNLKQGGELAFSLASVTAVTYPVVQTYLNMNTLIGTVNTLTHTVAEQGKVLSTLAESMQRIEAAINHSERG